MTAAIERLEELLDAKDDRISELESKLEAIEEQREWRWTLHRQADTDPLDLPVPRLQIACERVRDEWYAQTWTYSLVYRHFLGHVVWVPLGETKRTGGGGKQPTPDDLPLRDGAHIKHEAKTLCLPAYVVIEDLATLIK